MKSKYDLEWEFETNGRAIKLREFACDMCEDDEGNIRRIDVITVLLAAAVMVALGGTEEDDRQLAEDASIGLLQTIFAHTRAIAPEETAQ